MAAFPQSLLQYSPFRSYLVPGIILLVANGLLSLWVLRLTVSKYTGFGWWVIAQGIMSLGWLLVEIAMLRLIVWPHYLYGAVATALVTSSGIAIVRATARQVGPASRLLASSRGRCWQDCRLQPSDKGIFLESSEGPS